LLRQNKKYRSVDFFSKLNLVKTSKIYFLKEDPVQKEAQSKEMSWEMELSDNDLEELYEWIDRIPLSRQKKRIERDFSDGYCIAEIVRHFLPQCIEMHNLTPANNLQQKLANWGLLNAKTFSKFGLNVPLNITQNICNGKPGYIEIFLYNLRYKIDEKLAQNERLSRRQSDGSKLSARSSVRTSSPQLSKNKMNQMRLDFEMKVQENLQQAEEIKILEAKVRRLEYLLELKETKIDDLQEKLDKYRPTGILADEPELLAQKKIDNFKSSRQNSNRNSRINSILIN